MYGGTKEKLVALRNSGITSRRDIYGLRLKENPNDRFNRLVKEFEYDSETLKAAKKDVLDKLDNDSEQKDANEFKREWLSRYTFYKVEYEILVDEIEYIRNRANRLVSNITGMPSGSHNGTTDDQWIDIIDYTDKALDYLCTIAENCLFVLLEIEELIQGIDEPDQRMILNYRYIRGLSIKDIQKKTHYSRSYVWKLETKALNQIEIDFDNPKALKERIEKEYRRFEFEQDHFNPDIVDPDILNEYIDELKEDRDKAQKLIDTNIRTRRVRKNRRTKRAKERQEREGNNVS